MLLQKKNNLDFKSEIEYLAKACSIPMLVAEVLVSRGIKTEQDFVRFSNPIVQPLIDPFLMGDMRAICQRLTLAIDNHETIVIYSDYDADGVCSASILYTYLVSRGVTPIVHLPDRQNEGYGVHVEAIEFIAEQYAPDLIITCDCGISAVDEVEYIKDLGMDVIVTDHHELPPNLPNCLTLNCKLNGYPFDDLCGAGVVLKLVQAMGGNIDDYIGICAIATVADLVALVNENRTIVARGLMQLNANPSRGVMALMQSLGISCLSSTDISFKIAPRINVAGRMGDAKRAFRLFVSNSNEEIEEIISQLNNDNEERKALVDKIYKQALERLKGYNLANARAIVLEDDEWEKGVTGIVCARIASDFYRPTMLLSKSGDCFKATVRSINGVNIYDLLSAHSNLLLEFGGHSQAAGFSIDGSKIDEFRKSVNEYLFNNYSAEVFDPCMLYDAEIDCSSLTLEMAKALEKLEPFGQGNLRPTFVISSKCLLVNEMKNREHLLVTLDGGASLPIFGQPYLKEILKSNTHKKLAVELEVGNFRGEVLRLNLKGYSCGMLDIDEDLVNCQYLSQLAYSGECKDVQYFSNVNEVLDNNIFGTLVIAFKYSTYKNFFNTYGDRFLQRFFTDFSVNNRSKIILSPRADISFNYFDKIILLDTPLSSGYLKHLQSKCNQLFVVNGKADLPSIPCNRDVLLKCFSAIKESQHLQSSDFYEYADNLKFNFGISYSEIMLSILIFSELKIVKIQKKPYNVIIDKGVKAELNSSRVYRLFNE